MGGLLLESYDLASVHAIGVMVDNHPMTHLPERTRPLLTGLLTALLLLGALLAAAPAQAATTFTLRSLTATVTGSSVTTKASVTASTTTTVTGFGVCVQNVATGAKYNQQNPNVRIGTTTPATFTGTQTLPDGTYEYFACINNAGTWTNLGWTPTGWPRFTTPGATPPAEGTTAAATLNWGASVAGDEFNYTGAPDPVKWSVYGPYPGHAGNGLRDPKQVTVDGSKLVITGTANGTTGGVGANFDSRRYGRWESRIAIPAGDNEYHGVAILWPDNNNWFDGETDYAENLGDRSVMNFFYHPNQTQTPSASKALDVTQFHNYAVEWLPGTNGQDIVRGYVDGVKWFEDTTHHITGTVSSTLQLDWFPDSTADGGAQYLVDWTRVYNP